MKIKNKKASYKFQFLEKEIAGIILKGTEIKSIREGKAGFTDAYCYFSKNEMFIKNFYINEYSLGTCNNHDPKRDKKLLLTKKQLKKFQERSLEKGLTIIPTIAFINDNGIVKIEIALSKGKKIQDKRLDLKNREWEIDKKRITKDNMLLN